MDKEKRESLKQSLASRHNFMTAEDRYEQNADECEELIADVESLEKRLATALMQIDIAKNGLDNIINAVNVEWSRKEGEVTIALMQKIERNKASWQK